MLGVLFLIGCIAVFTAGAVAGRVTRLGGVRVATIAVLAVVVLSAVNAVRGGPLDSLTSAERATVQPALRSAAGCDGWFVHVAEIVPTDADGGPTSGFDYRCELTILGWPSFSGEAQCGDGTWYVSGWMDVQWTGSSCGSR